MDGSSDDNGSSSNGNNIRQDSPIADNNTTTQDHLHDNSSVPKPKRLACMICRKRKLKCDGGRPSCSSCSRLGHLCAYDEQRRKSGPKRGYVKALEERLKQVETLLKTQDPVPSTPSSATRTRTRARTRTMSISMRDAHNSDSALKNPAICASTMGKEGDRDTDRWQQFSGESPQGGPVDDFNFNSGMGMPMNTVTKGEGDFAWEMVGLGLEEPLPPQETIDELHHVYFEKVHPSMPMIHRYRYLAAMNLAPNQRPPVCLRYAMWTMACSVTDKYADLQDHFYRRARKYVEADHIKGYGENMISVAHCQSHVLLAAYEMKMMYFPRSWINTGSAVRLAQMMGLHRLDGTGLDVKQCLPPPRDWTEREERRRTFWMAFCEDRYASIGTGWPMIIEEKDIMTKMPSSDEAFDMSRPEQAQSIAECTAPSGAAKLSIFGGVVLMACLFGRNLVHLHRPDDDDQDNDLNGSFWKRHRQMDNILLNTSLGLPAHLKLPSGLSNPNVIFTNMSIHTSTICLHQAAIFKADKNKLPASISSESKVRCITAANEIASIMRTISHVELSVVNPFISFCLYVAARVFVQYLKSRPDDVQTAESLLFLLSTMDALKQRNPLTESFLVQLDVDFETLAIRIPKLRRAFSRQGDSFRSKAEGTTGPLSAARHSMEGILPYRECEFMKAAVEDENPANLADMSKCRAENAAARASISSSGGFAGQSWLRADQGSIPALTPSSGTGTIFEKPSSKDGQVSSFGDISGASNDKQVSPDGCQSNDAKLNSSGAGSAVKTCLAPGIGVTRQDNAYHSSPISPHQSLMNPDGSIDGSNQQNFYPQPSGYPMGPGMTGQPNGAFSMPSNGWQGINGQTQPANLAPVTESVLRALMNMGPMDAMDLSSWGSGQDNAMRG